MVKIQRANNQSCKFSVDWELDLSLKEKQISHVTRKAKCKHENQPRVHVLTLDKEALFSHISSMINSARGQ